MALFLLLALLITALMTGPVLVVQAIVPPGPWGLLLPLLAFVILETLLTTHWLMRPQQRQLNHFQYRVAEAIFLLLIVRLLTWIITGTNPTGPILLAYLAEPVTFFDIAFVIYALLTLIAWQETAYVTRLLLQLPPDEGEMLILANKASAEDRTVQQSDRASMAQQFFNHWIYGGITLIICAGLTTIDINQMNEAFSLRSVVRLGVSPLLLTALLLYLLVGLWLYSQVRWQMLRMRWLLERTTIQPDLERTWNRTSGWVIIAVALAAAFLPIGSTFGLARIVQFLIIVVMGLIQLFLTLVIFLLSLPLLLLSPNEVTNNVDPLPPISLDPSTFSLPPLEPSGPNLWTNGLFWLVLLILTIGAVIFFLRERGYPLPFRTLSQLWQIVIEMVRRWWHGARGRIQAITTALQRGRESTPASPPSSPWSFFRLNALSPREQIRYFYLAAVHRAGEKGVTRNKAETPLEFAQDLQQNWPEAQEEITQLTDAFLHARYSPQPVTPEDVNPIKRTWKQIKTTLRRQKKANDER